MTDHQSIECLKCHKKGPYIGGLTDRTWFLVCLWCGHSLETTKKIVRAQILLQQKLAGQRCRSCGFQVLAKGTKEDNSNDVIFTCEFCGFKEKMTPRNFESYMILLDGKLNP